MHGMTLPASLRRVPAPAVAAVLLLALSAGQGAALRAARHAAAPAEAAGETAGAPPLVAFATVALGGFRGILADALWLRADRLQQERRFVELVQLSDWITRLEPDNEDVWAFHAWNMAYNVSFLLSRPDDRWRWVQGGLSLLRDRGLPLNPGSARLKRELGWIFEHKIGMDGDSAGPFYRTQWAREAGAYLGEDGAPPAEGSIAADELLATLRMDPAFMSGIEARYGRIDWRVPAASSLYWSQLALDEGADGKEELPCRRMVYQSLVAMALGDGRLEGDPEEEGWTFRARPATHLIDAALACMEDTMGRTEFSGVRHAYAGLLLDATAVRRAEGREAEARAHYARLAAFLRENGVKDGIPPYEKLPPPGDPALVPLLERAGVL